MYIRVPQSFDLFSVAGAIGVAAVAGIAGITGIVGAVHIVGAIGIAGRTSHAVVCWSVMAADVFLMALLFEQMYEVALLGHLVIVPLILGGCVGMLLGGALVLFWVKNTNRFLRHLGFSSRKIGF